MADSEPTSPLFTKLSKTLMDDNLRLAELATMKLIQSRRAMCLDFYHGRVLTQDGGLDAYLLEFFKTWNSETNAMELPQKLVLEHAPVTEQLIDMKSRLYSEQPVRKVMTKEGDAKDAKDYTDLLERSKWFSISKRVDAYTQLLSQIALGVFVDTREDKANPVLRFQVLTEYWPIYDDDDPVGIEPWGIIYPSALRVKSGSTKGAQVWIRYDPEYITHYDPEGAEIPHADSEGNMVEREENPYKALPFIFPCRKIPISETFSLPRVSLVQANQGIDVAMVALNESVLRNGFKTLKVIGKGAQVSELVFGKSRAITAEPGIEGGQAASIDVLDMQGDFEQLINAIRFKTEMAGQALNVTVQWKIEGGAASGVSYEIMGIRDLDDRKSLVETYTETIERPLHEKVLQYKKKGGYGVLKVEEGKLIADFPEPTMRPSVTDRIAARNNDLKNYVRSYVDLVKEENPDLDDKAAADKLAKNIKINRPLLQGGIVTEEQVMAILEERDSGTGPAATPGATPPGAADNPGQNPETIADLAP